MIENSHHQVSSQSASSMTPKSKMATHHQNQINQQKQNGHAGGGDQFWQLIDDVVKHLDVAINDLSPDRDLSAINSIEQLLQTNTSSQSTTTKSNNHHEVSSKPSHQHRRTCSASFTGRNLSTRKESLDLDPLDAIMADLQSGSSNSGSALSGSSSSSRATPLSLSSGHVMQIKNERKMSDEDNTKVPIFELQPGQEMINNDCFTSASSCCTLQETCSINESPGCVGPEERYDTMSPSLPIEMPLYERLIRTQAIWFLPRLGRSAVCHLLTGKEPGTFIVRGSSSSGHRFALSVRLPESCGGPHVEHYLIELDQDSATTVLNDVTSGQESSASNVVIPTQPLRFHLEGSDFNFPSVPALVQHYAFIVDELPVGLVLPGVLMEASRTQLTSIALLGQEFWSSLLALPGAVYRSDRSPVMPVKEMVDRACSPTPSPFSSNYPITTVNSMKDDPDRSGQISVSDILKSADASPLRRTSRARTRLSGSESGHGSRGCTPLPPPIPPKRDVSDLDLASKAQQQTQPDQAEVAKLKPPPLPPKKSKLSSQESKTATNSSSLENKMAESVLSAGSLNLIELSSPQQESATNQAVTEENEEKEKEVLEQDLPKVYPYTEPQQSLESDEAQQCQQQDYEDIWSVPLLERLKTASKSRQNSGAAQQVVQPGAMAATVTVPVGLANHQTTQDENRKSTHSTHSTETVNSFQIVWTPSDPTLVGNSNSGNTFIHSSDMIGDEEGEQSRDNQLDLALGEIYADPADAITSVPSAVQIMTDPQLLLKAQNGSSGNYPAVVNESVQRSAHLLGRLPLEMSSTDESANHYIYTLGSVSEYGSHNGDGRLSRHYSDSNLPAASTSWHWSTFSGDPFQDGPSEQPGRKASEQIKGGFKTLDEMYDNMRQTLHKTCPGQVPPPLPASRPPPTSASRLSLESLLSAVFSKSSPGNQTPQQQYPQLQPSAIFYVPTTPITSKPVAINSRN